MLTYLPRLLGLLTKPGLFPIKTQITLMSVDWPSAKLLAKLPPKEFRDSPEEMEKRLPRFLESLRPRLINRASGMVSDVSFEPHQKDFAIVMNLTLVAHEANILEAAVKDSSYYTYFKLTSPKLVINRRGKDVVFKRGDPLGWRMSSSGTHLRLISPLHGTNIVYSIKIDDRVLAWLDKQDPKAPKRVGQLRSDSTEDSANRLLGFVITDGKAYYKLTPAPVMSNDIKREVVYKLEERARRDAAPFIKERKLKIKPVYSKDLAK